MHRISTHRILLSLKVILALFGALIVAVPNCVTAQETPSTPSVTTRGIRHILYLTVKSDDPDLRFLQRGSGESHTATLTVKIRISDHSQETNFYGDVPATVSDFDPIKGSREQEVWQHTECHHERGFPKITVISVDGQITNGQQKLTTAARYRRFGLLLPRDEVMAAKRLVGGTDDHGSFVATHVVGCDRPLGDADPVPDNAAATAAGAPSKNKNKSAAPRRGFARAPRARPRGSK